MKWLLLLCFFSTPIVAHAEVQTRATWTFGQFAGVALDDDGHTERLPVLAGFGGALLVVPFDGIAISVEGTLVTPMQQFTPAARIAVGPVFTLTNQWSVGVSALYQHRPEWEGVESNDQFGFGFGPGVKINDSVVLSTGIAGWKVLEDRGPLIFAVQLCKFSFTLPRSLL